MKIFLSKHVVPSALFLLGGALFAWFGQKKFQEYIIFLVGEIAPIKLASGQ